MEKAQEDFLLARRARESKTPLHDGVCFHCQQCAEKYLKGLMEELGLRVPKIHDLDELMNAVVSQHPILRSFRRGLVFLTQFAVDTRYPGKRASNRQAVSALRRPGRVRTEARSLLGIRDRRRKK